MCNGKTHRVDQIDAAWFSVSCCSCEDKMGFLSWKGLSLQVPTQLQRERGHECPGSLLGWESWALSPLLQSLGDTWPFES